MSKAQPLGATAGTVITATSSPSIDFTAESYYADKKTHAVVSVSSDQTVTLTMKFGNSKRGELISALPHTFTETVTGGTSLLVVMPLVPGWDMGRIYLANASGSTATYTMDAGLEEA